MEAIGERLRNKREELGLTLEQAAESTKFPPEVIEAVEEGRLGIFSAKVYHIAFIRAYAKLLKLDADELIRDQKSEEERAQEALRGIRTVPPKTVNPRRVLVGVAIVVAVAVVILLVTNRAFQSRKSGAEQPPVAAVDTRATSPVSAPKGTPKMIRVEGPAGQGQPLGAVAEKKPEEKREQASPEAGVADTTKPAAPTTVAGTNWPIVPPANRPGEGRPRTLEVSAEHGALMTISTGDSTLFEGSLSGGDKKVFTSGKRFILVFLSDRNAVSMTLDGKPVALPPSDKRQVFDYTLP